MRMQAIINITFYAGSVWFSSEMKALSDDCERFVSFLPGHIYSSKNGMPIRSSFLSLRFIYDQRTFPIYFRFTLGPCWKQS